MPGPTPPQNLDASSDAQTITLTWQQTSPGSFNIYRGTSEGGEAEMPVATGLTTTSYDDTGLEAATTYYYCATTVLSDLESGPSNEAFATTAN